jgi:hypothetical protein
MLEGAEGAVVAFADETAMRGRAYLTVTCHSWGKGGNRWTSRIHGNLLDSTAASFSGAPQALSPSLRSARH